MLTVLIYTVCYKGTGSPLFCYHSNGANGLIGMEFNSVEVKNDHKNDRSYDKKFWQKTKKEKMTLFLNIQTERKWIDSVLNGLGYLDDNNKWQFSLENDKCFPIWERYGGVKRESGSSRLGSRLTITFMFFLSFGLIVNSSFL